MFKFIKSNQRLILLLIFFLIINLYVVFSLNYYSDDWTFFARNHLDYFAHTYEHSYKIQKGVNREASIIFFYLINIFENNIYQNFLNLIFNFINFYLIFVLLKSIILKNIDISIQKNYDEILIILIIIYFFFPFNIGGQYWLTNIHFRVSLLFFLLSIYFLINKKIFWSIIFLILCFSSYEIFFLSYLFIVLIFYYSKCINKKDFKIYFVISLIIELFFIFIKKRESHIFEINNVIELFFYNFIRIIGSIYISISDHLSFWMQIVLFFPVAYYLIVSLKYIAKNKLDIFGKIFLCILISLIANNMLMSLGDYGYYGKGIFSRTMSLVSFGFLLFLSFTFLLRKIDNFTIFISYYLLLITTVLFISEINLWKKSSKIQNEIITSNILKSNLKKINRDLILFKGPCYYKRIEIFNSFDINRAIRENYSEIITKDAFFFPIQNWEGEIIDGGKRILFHTYKLDLYQYENIYLWDYYKKTFNIIGRKEIGYNKNYPNLNFEQKDCYIN